MISQGLGAFEKLFTNRALDFFPDFDFSIADELGHKRQAIAVFSCCLIFQLSFFCGRFYTLIALRQQQRLSSAQVLQFLAADDLTPKERQK